MSVLLLVPDTIEGSQCGQSIERMRAIDWPHRKWLVEASADGGNRKLGSFGRVIFWAVYNRCKGSLTMLNAARKAARKGLNLQRLVIKNQELSFYANNLAMVSGNSAMFSGFALDLLSGGNGNAPGA